MSRLERLALRSYPPSFRARYGAEMAALIEDLPRTARATADLFAGAARAWVRPGFPGPSALTQRLQASAATTWVAWSAAFFVPPAMTKALLDPPPNGLAAGVRPLLNVAAGLVVVGWLCALAGALAIVVKTLVPALRSHRSRPLRPLLAALILGVADGAAMMAWIARSHGHAERLAHPQHADLATVIPILIGFAAFLIALGTGPAMTLPRLDSRLAPLRIAAVMAFPVALCLAVSTALCAVAAVASASPGAQLFGSGVIPAVLLAFAGGASLIALVSSTKGVRALRKA